MGQKMEIIEHYVDFCVVGGGLAGMMAAISEETAHQKFVCGRSDAMERTTGKPVFWRKSCWRTWTETHSEISLCGTVSCMKKSDFNPESRCS